MRRCCPLLAFAAVCLVLSSRALAREIYVDNVAGDDRHSGHAPRATSGGLGPTRTLTRALRVAQAGDHIVVANTGQPYRESITLEASRHCGTSLRPFIISGNGAVLDGTLPVAPADWRHDRGGVFRFRPERLSYQQLFLDRLPATRQESPRGSAAPPPLKPLEWCLWQDHIYFRIEPGRTLDSYPLTHAGLPVGITLYNVHGVVIADLIVQGFQRDGVNAHDNVFDSQMLGLTARGNGRSGISVGGASRVRIEACLVGNNGLAQVRTEGWCQVEVRQSDLIPNTAPGWVVEGGRLTIDGRRVEGRDPEFSANAARSGLRGQRLDARLAERP
jgi:hypothetical protein